MKPNRTQKKLIEALLLQEAYIETIRPIIRNIYQEVFDYWFKPGQWVDKFTGEIVTKEKDLYRVDDLESDEIDSYYKELQTVLRERGYPPAKPGCCPLLEAESTFRDTQRLFVRECIKTLPENIVGKDLDEFFNKLLCNLKNYEKFYNLNMSYYIQFVDVDKLKQSVNQ